jgi:hypothetical protein
MSDVPDTVVHIIDSLESWVGLLANQGLHCGLGSPPVCIVDGEPWPCAHERRFADRE